ncbi:hypothetical protein HYW54_05530 [Candidatus Gottesmanbacteria bacterium]|nr:hypothetical protein [Candidatus Gottesmanbacteria bacterium]
MARKSKKTDNKNILILILLLASLAFSLFAVQQKTNLFGKAIDSLGSALLPIDEDEQKLKVIVIKYIADPNDIPTHPDILTEELKTNLQYGSAYHYYNNPANPPSLNIDIVDTFEHETQSPNVNDSVYESWQKILNDHGLCDRIANEKIDQIWIWGDPRPEKKPGPGLEYAISSKYFRGGVITADYAYPPFCSGKRSFIMFGFDYTRGIAEALESYSHYLEGLFANIQGSQVFWQQYVGNHDTPPLLSERCGSAHNPPNSPKGYEYIYHNQASVNSFCEDWHPDGSGTKKTFNCDEWKCDKKEFHLWWMNNMPNKDNTLTYQNKKMPNWWDFVSAMDTSISSYRASKQYYLNLAFLNLNSIPLSLRKQVRALTSMTQSNGTQAIWTHTAKGNERFILVFVSYRANTYKRALIKSMKFGDQELTKLRQDLAPDRNSQIWYLLNPPKGTFNIEVTWNRDPEAQVYTAVSLADVDQSDPIVTHKGKSEDVLDETKSQKQIIKLSGITDKQLVIAQTSFYPNGGDNKYTFTSTKAHEVWSIASPKQGIYASGAIAKTKESLKFIWEMNQSFSYSISVVAIRLSPNAEKTPDEPRIIEVSDYGPQTHPKP